MPENLIAVVRLAFRHATLHGCSLIVCPTRCDSFLQLYELEGALTLGLASRAVRAAKLLTGRTIVHYEDRQGPKRETMKPLLLVQRCRPSQGL
jgi:hypothetical protein